MDKKAIRQIVLSSAAYSLSSIIGPLIFLGVPAYFLDKIFDSSPIILLVAVFIAFIITNILLFKKVSKINQMIAEKFIPAKKEENPEKQDDKLASLSKEK